MRTEHILRILLCLLTVPSINATALRFDATEKTTISLRQADTGLGRELSLWHNHITTDIGNPYGMSVQITPFASFTQQSTETGKYFGVNDSNMLPITSDRLNMNPESSFPYHAIKHNPAAHGSMNSLGVSSDEKSSTLTLSPKSTSYGASIHIFQDCSNLKEGLSCSLQTAITQTETELLAASSDLTVTNHFTKAPLTHGLLGKKDAVLFGPLKLSLTYNIVETEKSFVGLVGGFSFSSTETSDQTHLFSPKSAQGGQHKLLCGLSMGTTLWEKPQSKGELFFSGQYAHLLADTPKRILGIYDRDGSTLAFSSYRLLGTKGALGVTPAANILHQTVNRDQSNQVEVSLMYAFTQEQMTGNIGYGLFARQAEQISLTNWDEGMYGRVSPLYDTSLPFDTASSSRANGPYLTDDMINRSVAESSAQVSCSLFAGIGYAMPDTPYPILLGIGGAYHYSFTRALPHTIQAWGKMGISF